jgi:hypothetical protein
MVWRNKARDWMRRYLVEHPCIDCGEADPIVLDFDHRRPLDKLGTVSDLVSRGRVQKAKIEAAKCDVRCSNCHRRRHAAERRTKLT